MCNTSLICNEILNCESNLFKMQKKNHDSFNLVEPIIFGPVWFRHRVTKIHQDNHPQNMLSFHSANIIPCDCMVKYEPTISGCRSPRLLTVPHYVLLFHLLGTSRYVWLFSRAFSCYIPAFTIPPRSRPPFCSDTSLSSCAVWMSKPPELV